MLRLMTALLGIGLLAMACNDGASHDETKEQSGPPAPKTLEDSLFKEVMAGHDAGMAKIGRVKGQLKETQRQLDSINATPGPKLNYYQRALFGVLDKLTDADTSMYQWMGSFKVDSAVDNKEQRIQYLQSEKVKVAVVKDKIFTALQVADSVFATRK